MSRVIKALLLCIYITLIVQYIKSLNSETKEEVLELEYMLRTPALMKKLEREMKKRRKSNVTIHYDIPERLPTDFKYILKFADSHIPRSTLYRSGQDEFIKAKCEYINCYLTSNKQLLFGFEYYDAIWFDVENTWDDYPLIRSPHQQYIFVASEPAQDYPICNKAYDDFYNLTWTYKLDSDISWPYFTVSDKNGTVVGPKIDMQWLNVMDATPANVKKKLKSKKKVAAWLVSNCQSSKRNALYEHLELEFLKYNMSIDVFGLCTKQDCSKYKVEDCLEIIEKEYYFYLAFENSLCEDYVTEKVLHGLLHYAVPIVYGGANYSRFLPTGSYINAYEETPENVVALVREAMQSPKIYEDYFRWHNHYVFKETGDISDAVCTLCEVMNRPPKNKTVKNFRKWWFPDYTKFKADCKY